MEGGGISNGTSQWDKNPGSWSNYSHARLRCLLLIKNNLCLVRFMAVVLERNKVILHHSIVVVEDIL